MQCSKTCVSSVIPTIALSLYKLNLKILKKKKKKKMKTKIIKFKLTET
jgi:hypothetical protein